MTVAAWLKDVPGLEQAADPVRFNRYAGSVLEAEWWASGLAHAAGLQAFYDAVDRGRFAKWTEEAIRAAWAGLVPLTSSGYAMEVKHRGTLAGRDLDGRYGGPEVGWWAEGMRVSWGLALVLGVGIVDSPGWHDHPAFALHRRFRSGLLTTVGAHRTQEGILDRVKGPGAKDFLALLAERQLEREAGA